MTIVNGIDIIDSKSLKPGSTSIVNTEAFSQLRNFCRPEIAIPDSDDHFGDALHYAFGIDPGNYPHKGTFGTTLSVAERFFL